jgi:glycosyltransferase involved in cell wall biosynthesis
MDIKVNKKGKVVVAHPGRQHSFRLAIALKKGNILDKYITTIYDKESSNLMKITKWFLGKDDLKRANGRKSSFLEDSEVIQYSTLAGLLLLLLYRIDKKGMISNKFQQFVSNRFGIKVAKYAIKHNVDAVIMYDRTASKCFDLLKKEAPNIIRIMDVSIANRIYTREFIESNLTNKEINEYRRELPSLWNGKFLADCYNEISKSDYFLVASNFVKDSLKFSGINESQIKIVPYGVDINKFKCSNSKSAYDEINFVFVGQISNRKGLRFLLKVFKNFEKKNVHLTLVGKYNENSEIYHSYKNCSNITFVGLVTQDKVAEIYSNSDAFILPSLSEGMALVGLEALGSGLPLICTENTGINDLIKDEYNGFVIPAANGDAIANKIQWFIDNKDRIPEMRKNARRTAEQFTWEHYEKNILLSINDLIDRRA